MKAKEITTQTIDKNGFVKINATQYVLPLVDKEIFVCIAPIAERPNTNGNWLVAIANGYTDAKIVITYVHELQQAFTLCGVDKKIEV